MTLPRDAIDLLAEFARHGVDALLVGGWAVALHGRPRTTKDVDLWLRDDAANLERARAALLAFGAPRAVLDGLSTATPDDVVWMGRPPNRIDLLKGLPDGDFDRAWASRVEVDVAGLAVPLVGREELIRLERASGRPVDLEDARLLERMAATE